MAIEEAQQTVADSELRAVGVISKRLRPLVHVSSIRRAIHRHRPPARSGAGVVSMDLAPIVGAIPHVQELSP